MTAKHPKHKERLGVDKVGRTPLHYAAAAGDTILVKRLLAEGMEAAAADDSGWTPLHFAAQSNVADIATLLLDAGSPIDPRDAHGNTPLSNAVFNSRGNGDVIKLLRSRGADPLAMNDHGISPLKLARTIANIDVKQFFIDLPEQ